MNLQENIHRIKEVMAIIKESSDEEPNVIRKMIDGIGIQNTIKMVGNYDLIRPYLKNIDKINFIKEKVKKIDEGGFGLSEIGESPIFYSENDNELRQIEYLSINRAYIDIYATYSNAQHIGDIRIEYEKLPEDITNDIFKMLLNK
jgi:hypothetical protein